MNQTLETYLDSLQPANQESWTWGAIKLEAWLYIIDVPPPLKLITSARAIMFKDNHIMTVTNPGETHILPGGRREDGETLIETVQRECLEETGWVVRVGEQIAVTHCQHQTPKPLDYPYPYPDFMQVIYLAEAIKENPSARIHDDYEIASAFRTIDVVKQMPLTQNQHLMLEHALTIHQQ